MDELFKAQVDVDIDYDSVKPEFFDYESRYFRAKISYGIDVEYKSWGISSIRFDMPDQELDVEIEVIMFDKEDPEYVSLKLKLKDIKIEAAKRMSPQADICPNELSVKILSIVKISDNSYCAEATGTLIFNDTSND